MADPYSPLIKARLRRAVRRKRLGPPAVIGPRQGVPTPAEWAQDWKEHFAKQAKRKKGQAS